MPRAARVAVIGAGWAGLAAAVECAAQGHAVTVIDMAPQPGGRARSVEHRGSALDNGQHILIGAYVETLALMRRVGVDPDAVLQRLPLTLRHADGRGLALRPGRAVPAFVRAVLAHRGWPWTHRLALLRAALGWQLRGFRAPPQQTVASLSAALPASVREELIEPLCVAALNTPAASASASVFLRVIRDALFSGPGAADLLLPARRLGELLPGPACRWLQARGASLRFGQRVQALTAAPSGWRVDDEMFDAAVLAASPRESARLARPIDAAWSECAAALRYEPIATVYLRAATAQLAAPILALRADDTERPAQFVFDLGALGGEPGRLAFVVSGAAPWVERGPEGLREATVRQAREQLGVTDLETVAVLVEKRATFRCEPALRRPWAALAPRLAAAGDHIEGPYPATLEQAVRSGLHAARLVCNALRG